MELPDFLELDADGELRFKGHRLRLIDVAARFREGHSAEGIAFVGYQHQNRRGQVYHLQDMSKDGLKPRYSFTRNLTGRPVDALPEGYEAYERVEDAQVFLRKRRRTAILPAEIALTEAAIRRVAKLKHFLVRAEDKSIVVYLADLEPADSIARLAQEFGMSPSSAADAREREVRDAAYTQMFRFTLTDPATRTFDAERWCFLGSIDNWYFLGGGPTLHKVLDAYVPHLGKESFFELMEYNRTAADLLRCHPA